MIQCITISRIGYSDRLAWIHTENGIYSIKSGYRIATELLANEVLGIRKKREGVVK